MRLFRDLPPATKNVRTVKEDCGAHHLGLGDSQIVFLTKLGGTAKAGVVFAIARQVRKPIYFIGIGEGIDDLKPFAAEPFVDALLANE